MMLANIYMLIIKCTEFLSNITLKKKLLVNKHNVICFSPTTLHTLYNPTNVKIRTITVKSPTTVLDWRPSYNPHPIKSNYAKIIKSFLSKIEGGTKISFSVKDKHYDYKLEILELKKGSVIECVYNKDKYFFVIKGQFIISHKKIKKHCFKDDYIVMDKNTEFEIKTQSKCSLYSVNIEKKKS